MPAITLTPAQRKALRADAHHLDPVVLIGSDGLTPAVIKETDAALKAHGLIKVRVFSDDREARETIWATLCDTLGAAPIQHIGKLLILWRPVPAKQKEAVENRNPGPRVVTVVKASRSGTRRPTVTKVQIMGNQRVTAGGQIKRVKKRAISVKKQSQD